MPAAAIGERDLVALGDDIAGSLTLTLGLALEHEGRDDIAGSLTLTLGLALEREGRDDIAGSLTLILGLALEHEDRVMHTRSVLEAVGDHLSPEPVNVGVVAEGVVTFVDIEAFQ